MAAIKIINTVKVRYRRLAVVYSCALLFFPPLRFRSCNSLLRSDYPVGCLSSLLAILRCSLHTPFSMDVI